MVPKLLRNIQLDAKKVVSSCMFALIFLLIWDSLFTEPENRILRPDFSQHFLVWVQQHPAQGLLWILLFMASAVVFMIPIGTPITVGCGYIYKGAYGWKLGVLLGHRGQHGGIRPGRRRVLFAGTLPHARSGAAQVDSQVPAL